MARPPVPRPDPHVTASRDGFALRFGGEVVAEYPGLLGAKAGRDAAKASLDLLDDTLAMRRCGSCARLAPGVFDGICTECRSAPAEGR